MRHVGARRLRALFASGLSVCYGVTIMQKKRNIAVRLLSALLLLTSLFSLRASGQSASEIYGGDIYWNATPNDVNHLLKNLKDIADINYNMDVRRLNQVSVDPEKNPVLFRSGHYNFDYTVDQRRKLREFLLGGGMIIYNTGLGSAPFYRSVIREMKQIFPEQPVQRLTSDHPIFHAFYDVDRVKYTAAVRKSGFKGDEPWFDAIEINCRVVALVSRWGMAVGWQDAVQESYQAYAPESAFKLGMNIFAYASAMRAWAKNASNAMKFVDEEDSATDRVSVVQVIYDGVWKTRHSGISVLLHTFNQRTEVPVKFKVRDLRLSSREIYNAPMLYMTGHEHFELSREEIISLRKYLQNGGFLLAEACCGRKGFDLAFRRLMQTVMPANPLKRIGTDSPLFQYPHKLKTLGVTPTLSRELGKAVITPYLEGVMMEDNIVVVYSRFGMSGGWEMSQSPYAKGYNDIGSLKLGQCILMHAVTQ